MMKIALFHNPAAARAMLKGSKLVRQFENAAMKCFTCRLRVRIGKERFVNHLIE
jgi:hypothetical protein